VIEDTPIDVTVSIGVAIGTGDRVVDLVRRSNNAMYTAKRRRRAAV
jgi:GGDEF domain-containing protein